MEKLLDKEFEVLRVVKDHQNVAKIYALQKRKVYGGWEGRELMEYCPIGLFDYLKALEKDKKFIPEDEIWAIHSFFFRIPKVPHRLPKSPACGTCRPVSEIKRHR